MLTPNFAGYFGYGGCFLHIATHPLLTSLGFKAEEKRAHGGWKGGEEKERKTRGFLFFSGLIRIFSQFVKSRSAKSSVIDSAVVFFQAQPLLTVIFKDLASVIGFKQI